MEGYETIKDFRDVKITHIVRKDSKVIKVYFDFQYVHYFLLLRNYMSQEKVELYSGKRVGKDFQDLQFVDSTEFGNNIQELLSLDSQVYQSIQVCKKLIKQLCEFEFFSVDTRLLEQLDIYSNHREKELELEKIIAHKEKESLGLKYTLEPHKKKLTK